MNVTQVGSSLSLQRQALYAYINALEALYLIERVRPWIRTDYERVGKQDKLFMTDSGLMASVLGWNKERIRFDPDRSGKLIETFAFNKLAAQVDASNSLYTLWHYRDRQKAALTVFIKVISVSHHNAVMHPGDFRKITRLHITCNRLRQAAHNPKLFQQRKAFFMDRSRKALSANIIQRHLLQVIYQVRMPHGDGKILELHRPQV